MANTNYNELLRLAKDSCQPDHVPGRRTVQAACKTCFADTVRADERARIEAEMAREQPELSHRAVRAQRMRKAGVAITAIMEMLGASYDEVWTWLNDWPHESTTRSFSGVTHPVFVAVA